MAVHRRKYTISKALVVWNAGWLLMGTSQDMFIILTSSCARFMPSRRGYSRVSLGHENGRGRGRRNEDEDRLIDNLDEEWDD